MRRRTLLQTAPLAALLAACGRRERDIEVGWLGQDPQIAHRLRTSTAIRPATKTLRVDVAIVGGGVAGLSAAWWLTRESSRSVAVLDMQDAMGGNARGALHGSRAFPLGAHYLPAPEPRAAYVRQLLADLGVLRGDPFAARADYDPRMVCFAPQERLWFEGAWHEGILPASEGDAAARRQFEAFHALTERWAATGSFAMPNALARLTDEARALDRTNFAAYLHSQGLDHPWLHWYADYCCRDDYGTGAAQTSAYFGVHYFASRHSPQADAARPEPVLTWPQGNGWLTARMAERIAARQPEALHTRMLTLRVEDAGPRVLIDALDLASDTPVRIEAARAVLAVPAFAVPRMVAGCPAAWQAAAGSIDYAPWLVANLALRNTPYSLDGTPVAWDNVVYGSRALGYVNAAHQQLAARTDGATTWTWYYAPGHLPPSEARKQLLDLPAKHWLQTALAELAPLHPNLVSLLERADVSRYGHAMARPVPGALTDARRAALRAPIGRLMLAHADLAGYSVFEEANYFGVKAAQWAMNL